jgi:hypothetical protein
MAFLVAVGVTTIAARFASAQAGPLPVDTAWFVSLARAESLMAGASACGGVDSTERAAVAEQIRIGVHVLGSLIHASVSADTLLAGPLVTLRAPEPPTQRWTNRFLKMTGVISVSANLVHLVASLSGASPETRNVLAYVGGSAAGIGSVFNRLRAPSPPAADPVERVRLVGLETDLRETVYETERAVEPLWAELRIMAVDSCEAREHVVRLARRYAAALQMASVVLDSRVAKSAAIARGCAQYPGFDQEAYERLEALTSHLDAIGESWRERSWLFERSRRNALDYLVLVDRP